MVSECREYLLNGWENYITSHPERVTLWLAGAVAAVVLVVLYLLAQLMRLRRRYAFLLRTDQTKDLGELFADNGRRIERLEGAHESLKALAAGIAEKQRRSLQGVGIVRFDAFDDVGGQQSYAVALVDEAGNGVIVSSVYSRNDSRTYAKEVRGGRCPQTLSSEEQEALDIAVGTNPPPAEAIR